MLRVLAAILVTGVTVVAQAAPDLAARADRLSKSGRAPTFVDAIPRDTRDWSAAVLDGVPAADRARLFADPLAHDDVGRALAVAAVVEAAGADAAQVGPESLYREFEACRMLVEVARSAEVGGAAMQLPTPEWLQRVAAPARARSRACAARLLREHPEHQLTARVILRGALDLVDEPEIEPSVCLSALGAALARLGDAARAEDLRPLFWRRLRALDVDGAAAVLAQASAAAPPFDLQRQERLLDWLELCDRLVRRCAELQRRVAAGEDSPLLQLQLACAVAAKDVDERCRALIAAGVEHALPDTLLASRALAAGRREEAAAHVARARSLPGADEGVAVLTALLHWPALMKRMEDGLDDDAVALEVELLLAEMDELLGDGDEPVVGMLRGLRDAGWPQVGAKEISRHFAEVYGGRETAPTMAAEYALALAGVMAGLYEHGADLGEALRFLEAPVADALCRRPMLMRQRAAAATAVAAWGLVAEASPEMLAAAKAQAAAARAHCRSLGDGAVAGYLEAVERWVGARTDEQQRAVLEHLRGLDVSPVQSGAWLPGSAPMVLGCALDGAFDREAFVQLRMATGRGRDPLALVPLAVAGTIADPAGSRQMLEYLRGTVRDDRARNLLAVAEIEAGAAPAVTAARARQVLADEAWSEHEARQLAHGVWLRFQVDWGIDYRRGTATLDVDLTCHLILLPKLAQATRLRALTR